MARTDRFHPEDPTHRLFCPLRGCNGCWSGPWWRRHRSRARRRAVEQVMLEQLEENRGRLRGPNPNEAWGKF